MEKQVRIENLVLVADAYGDSPEKEAVLKAVNGLLAKLNSCPVLSAEEGGYRVSLEPMASE